MKNETEFCAPYYSSDKHRTYVWNVGYQCEWLDEKEIVYDIDEKTQLVITLEKGLHVNSKWMRETRCLRKKGWLWTSNKFECIHVWQPEEWNIIDNRVDPYGMQKDENWPHVLRVNEYKKKIQDYLNKKLTSEN